MKYQRSDGIGKQDEVIVNERFSTLVGLAELKEYEIVVAGITSKGIGVYSSKTTVTTLASGKKVNNKCL